VASSILFYWIIDATDRFSGSETLLGIAIFIIICLYYSIYPIIFSLLYSLILKNKKTISSSVVRTVFIAAFLWIILEWVKMNVLLGIPWVKDTLSISQLRTLNGIQLASITGPWGISFVIVAVNQLFALAIKQTKLKYGIYAIAIVALFYISGFVIFTLFDSNWSKEIKVAIIQENIKAETRWNEETGDRLAQQLFDLNRKAASHNPNLIVWSETSIPWTYSTDDDLINMALDITKESKAEHIIGIFSKAETDTLNIYNSAYLINAEGVAVSRYDKVTLLSFLETPFLSKSLIVPFLSQSVYTKIIAGSNYHPLEGRFGNMGVLICNESLTPYETKKMLKRGANILITLSNDAWIENTHLNDWHFYACRSRAVESGKDIVINSNRGIGGVILGNGVIQVQNLSQYPACTTGSAKIRENSTLYYKFGDWYIYLSVFLFLILIIKK